jgi:hypothetical protein
MTKNPTAGSDPEIVAISAVYAALKGLEPEAQARVLNYVALKLKIEAPKSGADQAPRIGQEDRFDPRVDEEVAEDRDDADEELEGISPVAKRWMARNGLQANQLSTVFSLGVDEIDLIAKAVPGKNKKERMHSVFLLKGIAAYLGTGAARFTHEQMKETCLHYDAFDAANFAVYLKNLSSEVSGSKGTGYTLTSRGLTNATEMVKTITQPGKVS